MAEFWPRNRWPGCAIPHPPLWRRLLCLAFGHRWATSYWTALRDQAWPRHEYCETCWKHRDKEQSDAHQNS